MSVTSLAADTRRGRDEVYRAGKFGAVGVAGLAVNLVVQAAFTEIVGMNYIVAAILATQFSSTFNFIVADRWVFDDTGSSKSASTRFVSFLAMNNAALVLRVPLMWGLVGGLGVNYVFANLLSLMVMTVSRFVIADNLIWGTSDVLTAKLTRTVVGDETAARRSSTRRHWVMLGAIVSMGAVLRIWKLGAVGFNSDEAVYAGQAAAIAGDEQIARLFPIFRAHPLLFQAILSVPYHLGTSVMVGRLMVVVFGLGTIALTFLVGRLLYSSRVGLIASMIVALSPYHVIVSRQVLLDAPMTFFATLGLYLLARFAVTRRPVWLYAAAGGVGLTVLAKETYIILAGSVLLFLALSPDVRVRLRDVITCVAVGIVVLLPFPLTVIMAGKSETGKSYLSWQLFRRPNHSLGFYPTTLPYYIGPLVLAAAVAAVALTWGARRTFRERLLLSWFAVPAVFLEIWPVKGFHYLLAASVPVIILAAMALSSVWDWGVEHVTASRMSGARLGALAVSVMAVSLVVPSWIAIQPPTSSSFLAGTGGVPGGREVGHWISDNVPEGAELMTVGPSMANIIQFYGHRKAYGLSVSPNPLNRNPSYQPILNPDLAIRTNNLQYVVWDSYSTKRSSFFGDKVISFADRYNGRVVFTYESAGEPVIVVYEVRP